MIPWWHVWEGIVGEYWDGAWRLVVDDLGGDVGVAMTVPVEDHLLVAIDRIMLKVFVEEKQLAEISTALRLLLSSRSSLNTPGLYAGLPLSPSLKNRRNLWTGARDSEADRRQTMPEWSDWARRRLNDDRFKNMD